MVYLLENHGAHKYGKSTKIFAAVIQSDILHLWYCDDLHWSGDFNQIRVSFTLNNLIMRLGAGQSKVKRLRNTSYITN